MKCIFTSGAGRVLLREGLCSGARKGMKKETCPARMGTNSQIACLWINTGNKRCCSLVWWLLFLTSCCLIRFFSVYVLGMSHALVPTEITLILLCLFIWSGSESRCSLPRSSACSSLTGLTPSSLPRTFRCILIQAILIVTDADLSVHGPIYKGHMYLFFWISDLGVSFVCLLVLQAAEMSLR